MKAGESYRAGPGSAVARETRRASKGIGSSIRQDGAFRGKVFDKLVVGMNLN